MTVTTVRYTRTDKRIAIVTSVNPFSVKGAAYYQEYAVSDETKRMSLIRDYKHSTEQEACAYFDSLHPGESNV